METTVYHCDACKKELSVNAGAEVPECCGKPMTPGEALPVCEMATSPEHSRMDGGEPCDDGRAGR
jgi:hypothetical protein